MTDASMESGLLEILGYLETSVTPVAGIENLLISTQRAFQLIEPWCQATSRSDNSTVKDIVTQIKQCTGVYLDAIDMSIRISENGVSFAEDAFALCGLFSRGVQSESLVAFLDDMISLAEKAHYNAQQTTEKFRLARRGFLQVTNSISNSVVKVQDEAERAHKSRRRYERASTLTGLVHTSATKATVFLEGNSGLISSYMPLPISIILPIMLALVVLAAKGGSNKFRQAAHDREMREISCEDAIAELHEINADLVEILQNVTMFANWWSNITGNLVTIRDSTGRLNSLKVDELNRLNLIQERWLDVKNQYMSYGREISKLQDFYPHIPRLGEGSFQIIAPTPPENVSVLGINSNPSIDLTPTIRSLAEHVGTCRGAFYGLQVALRHVKGKDTLKAHQCLDDIKLKIVAEWEGFTPYLHQVLSFREEIRLYPLDLKTPENFAIKPMDMLQNIINRNTTSRETLNRHKTLIMGMLLLVESRQRSGHLCGSEALEALERSLADVSLRLDDSMRFWRAFCHTSTNISNGSIDPGVCVLQADQKTIQTSITSISMSYDTLSAMDFANSPGSNDKGSRKVRLRLKTLGK